MRKKLLLAAVVVVATALAMIVIITPKAKPEPPLPTPNGYDDFQKAATLLSPYAPDWQSMQGEEQHKTLKLLVATNQAALAQLQTEVQIAQVFVERCCELLLAGDLDDSAASMAKYWCTDLQCKVMDECVQLHGGYGYMWEMPITRAYADARVQRIYGGTNEIMKEVIARRMGLAGR